MPIYCYTSKDGETIQEPRPLSRFARSIVRKGKRFYIDVIAQRPCTQKANCWPMRSWNCGVPRAQAEEANRQLRQRGITDAHIDPRTGDAVFDSRKGRKKFMQAFRLFDRDGGYGDQAPQHAGSQTLVKKEPRKKRSTYERAPAPENLNGA